MTIIFSDSNVIFGMVEKYILLGSLEHSAMKELSQRHRLFVSSYVFKELEKNLPLKKGIYITLSQFFEFLKYIGCGYIDSVANTIVLEPYISDSGDLQILADALSVDADFLLTKNIKDFKVELIQQTFGIQVVREIPSFLLQ